MSTIELQAQVQTYRAGGAQAFKAEDYPKAIELLKKAVKADREDAMSWYMLGSAYLKKGKNKDGVKALESAVKIEPKNSVNLAGLAFAYMLTGNKKAEITAKEAIKANPQSTDAHFILGKIALLNGSYNAAFARANKVIELNPKIAGAYRLKGEALLGSFAVQTGTVVTPPENRYELLNEASVQFEKYLSMIPDEEARNETRMEIESLRAFAEYYSMREKKGAAVEVPLAAEPGIIPFKIISRPHASYTDNTRRDNVRGTLALLAVFRSDAKVGKVIVVKSLHRELDQNAIEAARKIQFVPETRNGVPITVVRLIEYSFTIY